MNECRDDDDGIVDGRVSHVRDGTNAARPEVVVRSTARSVVSNSDVLLL